MDRRKLLTNLAAAGVLSGPVQPAAPAAEPSPPAQTMARRELGRTGRWLSPIGFGGIIVMNVTLAEAARYVGEAFERGVNYFDVAPSYGNAQERLGPALKPYRERVFLAGKTAERGAAAARKELHESLRLLRTDHLDLYQLHGLTSREEVEQAFAKGGAMEALLQAREAGKVRLLGFSAHSEEAAHAAMDRFDFDTLLFPFNFITWHKGHFGPSVHQRAKEKGMGLLALKAMAHQPWPQAGRPAASPWVKCWYEPLAEAGPAALALRFTLGLPVTAALPPGHWPLFELALGCVESGRLGTLTEDEHERLRELAETATPIFSE